MCERREIFQKRVRNVRGKQHLLSQLSCFLFYLSQKRTRWSKIFSSNFCCTEDLQHQCKAVTVIRGVLWHTSRCVRLIFVSVKMLSRAWGGCCAVRSEQLLPSSGVSRTRGCCKAPLPRTCIWLLSLGWCITPRMLYHCLSLKHERKIKVSKPYNKLG